MLQSKFLIIHITLFKTTSIFFMINFIEISIELKNVIRNISNSEQPDNNNNPVRFDGGS